jgi:hypothetical protein
MFQLSWGIGYDTGMSQTVDRNRMDHQRVQENHITDVAGHLMEFGALLHNI